MEQKTTEELLAEPWTLGDWLFGLCLLPFFGVFLLGGMLLGAVCWPFKFPVLIAREYRQENRRIQNGGKA